MVGPVVTLLSDFGTTDGYVGAIKGVILSRAPGAQLVDISHDIPPQDVRAGARALRQAVPWFPVGSIHLAVVDPGVGTSRRPLLLRSRGQLLVGPDNGLLSLAVASDAEAWVLDRPELFLDELSATFHGRDLFASIAGHLAAGRSAESCGSRAEHFARLEEPRPRAAGPDLLVGQVLHVDRFGNLITNLRRDDVPAGSLWSVSLGTRELGPIRSTYQDAERGQWLSYWGSSGELEIAVRDGSAAAELSRAGIAVEAEAQPASTALEVRLCRR